MALDDFKLVSSEPSPSALPIPEVLTRLDRGLLIDYEMGGVSIQDPSQGMSVRVWKLWLDGSNVVLAPDDAPYLATVLFSGEGITELTLAFDSNMTPVVAYVQAGVTKLRWYDLSLAPPSYVTTVIDGSSPYLSFDDRRQRLISKSDAMLFYLRDGIVRLRLLRDRFLTEYDWATIPAGATQIVAAGFDSGFRMQLVFFSDTSAGFLVGMEDPLGFCRLDFGKPIYGSWTSSATDQLFIGDSTGFSEFASGDPLDMSWKSKDYLMLSQQSFSAILIDATGQGSVTVWADGEFVATIPVNGFTRSKLPSVTSALRWAVEVKGTPTVRRIVLANSFAETQNG